MFGRAAVANQDYVATGLRLIEGGVAGTELAKFALDERLGASASNEAVVTRVHQCGRGGAWGLRVELLLRSALGRPIHADELGYHGHVYAENKVNINLMGLALRGIEYTMVIRFLNCPGCSSTLRAAQRHTDRGISVALASGRAWDNRRH